MATRLVEFELVGARDFAVALERATDEVKIRCARVCQDTAFRIKHRAIALAPEEEGHLKRVISAQGKGLNWRVGLLDLAFPSRGGDSAHQHPWVYGVWYEYGFVTRNITTHAYMRPAADAEQDRHYAALTEAVNSGLERAA